MFQAEGPKTEKEPEPTAESLEERKNATRDGESVCSSALDVTPQQLSSASIFLGFHVMNEYDQDL